MRILILALNLMALNLNCSFGQTRNDIPFDTIDFSKGEWLLVFNEIITPENWADADAIIVEKIQIIDNEQILDSLKRQFTCNLKEMIDGDHEYVVTIYKDGKLFKEYVWANPENLHFGALETYFQKASTQYFQTSSLDKLNEKIKQWSKQGLYIITNKYSKRDDGDYYVLSYQKE